MSLVSLPLTPLALIVALPIAICILDNLLRMVGNGANGLFSSEGFLATVVCGGMVGNYVMGGAVVRHLGHEIAGLLDQVLVAL